MICAAKPEILRLPFAPATFQTLWHAPETGRWQLHWLYVLVIFSDLHYASSTIISSKTFVQPNDEQFLSILCADVDTSTEILLHNFVYCSMLFIANGHEYRQSLNDHVPPTWAEEQGKEQTCFHPAMPIVVLQMTCGHRWLEFACQHQLGYAILCLSVSMNMNGWTKSKQGSYAENNGKTIAVCSWIQLVPARFCWCLVVPCCHPLRLCSLAMLELGPGSADCGHLEGVLACIIRGQQAHRFFAKWGIQQWCLASVYRSKLRPSQDTSLWTDSARGIVGLHSTKARVRAYECTTWTLSWWRMLMDADVSRLVFLFAAVLQHRIRLLLESSFSAQQRGSWCPKHLDPKGEAVNEWIWGMLCV